MPATVLYIEDHPDNMMLIRRILLSESYTLVEASTGLQGLSCAESQEIDLILLDVNLPDIDGYEVARRLRTSPKAALACIPIVPITANAMRGDAERIIKAGADIYISKPINIQELLNTVQDLIHTEGRGIRS